MEKILKNLYQIPNKCVVTAHRGFSGRYPENTLLAFSKAVELGVDIVEFDVRQTLDGELIILHDPKLDRTTNGTGSVDTFTLAEIKKLDASFRHDYQADAEESLEPRFLGIPTLQEVLELLVGKTFFNIQVYTSAVKKIADLYDRFDLYDRAFLMISTFDEAAAYRSVNPRIQLCVGEDRGNLERHHAFGSDFIQPTRDLITPGFCRKIEEYGLCANMFYSNNAEDNLKFLKCGIKGIMTDYPDVLLESCELFQSYR